jgi:hypothetical protein
MYQDNIPVFIMFLIGFLGIVVGGFVVIVLGGIIVGFAQDVKEYIKRNK